MIAPPLHQTIEREKYMDQNEIRQLMTVTEAKAITDAKHGRKSGVVTWMLVDLALQTGLRVSEMSALNVGDFNGKRGTLSVVRVKRKKRKAELLAIPSALAKHLGEFIAWKQTADEPTDPKAPLLAGRPRGPYRKDGTHRLQVPALQCRWKAAIKAGGLPAEISIHCARHSVAVALLKKTGNLRQVQKQLGHSSPAITAAFYADVSFEDMREGVTGLWDQ